MRLKYSFWAYSTESSQSFLRREIMYDDEGFLPEELDELEREFVEAVETGPPLEEEDEEDEEEEEN